MLNYGLPAAPEGHRWYIRTGSSLKYRYLHLERKGRFGKWVGVQEQMISTHKHAGSFESETIKAAQEILRVLKVVVNLPTGEVI